MYPLSDFAWPLLHEVGQQELKLLRSALESPDWSHSELSRKFEDEFADFIGVKHALLCPSGTSAIYMALVAAGIEQGQEVIIPGITWPSVVYSVISAGGVPITVDIDRDSLCMSPETIEPHLSERTFAILATHLFGSQCEMPGISALASDRDIYVIEDAAQSVGSAQGDTKCGKFGLAGAFSLNDKKILACGEGGCVTTDDSGFYEELKRLQLIQPTRSCLPQNLPGTFKVSEFQAAVALGQLRRLDSLINKMSTNAEYLAALFDEVDCLTVQTLPALCSRQSYYNFCFNCEGANGIDELRSVLGERLGLRIAAPYPPLRDVSDFHPTRRPIPQVSATALSLHHANCDDAFHNRTVRLPHFILKTDRDVMDMIFETVCSTLNEFGIGNS